MKRLILWTLAGAAVFVALKASAKKKTGELTLTVAFKKLPSNTHEERSAKGDVIRRVFDSILTVSKACPGMPPVKQLLNEGEVTITDSGDTSSAQKAFSAEWSHDRLGPLKTETLQCLLRHLQSVEPLVVAVSATRTS